MSETISATPIVPNIAVPSTMSTVQDSSTAIVSDDTKSESNLYSYIFIGVLLVVLILLLYYAYNRFVSNSVKEPFTKGNQQERDDPVVDFNLREVIEELKRMQGQVLKTLSEQN